MKMLDKHFQLNRQQARDAMRAGATIESSRMDGDYVVAPNHKTRVLFFPVRGRAKLLKSNQFRKHTLNQSFRIKEQATS